MNFIQTLWQRLDTLKRIGLLLGVAIIIAATVALGAWSIRTDYQVLFADLGPQDAATMVAELERLKTPYRLSGDGNTILVPADLVYKTRLKLVGKELPLRGAVGFELFNDSEVGMTEFAQKVNYQRALQGELTRTILALDEVQAVRVHLVLPEQVLFKKTGASAKASISITAKPGKTLTANEVQGIQRLVGAAVPNIKPEDVTIVDQHGVALTRRSSNDADTGMSSAALDEKRAIETYLNKKITEVLDRALGNGQGLASVDVTLNLDQTKVTTENVLPATGRAGGATGVITREKQTARDGNTDLDPARAAATGTNTGWSIREVDYQSGRRVEQVVSAAGAVNHVNVAVVVLQKLEQTQLERLKDLVAVAAGINRTRGDALAVYCVDQVTGARSSAATTVEPPLPAEPHDAVQTPIAPPALNITTAAKPGIETSWLIFAGAILLVLLYVFMRSGSGRKPAALPRKLSELERQRALTKVQQWLKTPTVIEAGANGPATERD